MRPNRRKVSRMALAGAGVQVGHQLQHAACQRNGAFSGRSGIFVGLSCSSMLSWCRTLVELVTVLWSSSEHQRGLPVSPRRGSLSPSLYARTASEWGHGGLRLNTRLVLLPAGNEVQPCPGSGLSSALVGLDLARSEGRVRGCFLASSSQDSVCSPAARATQSTQRARAARRATPLHWAPAIVGVFSTCCGAGASPASLAQKNALGSSRRRCAQALE
jgi:hypothetical protein